MIIAWHCLAITRLVAIISECVYISCSFDCLTRKTTSRGVMQLRSRRILRILPKFPLCVSLSVNICTSRHRQQFVSCVLCCSKYTMILIVFSIARYRYLAQPRTCWHDETNLYFASYYRKWQPSKTHLPANHDPRLLSLVCTVILCTTASYSAQPKEHCVV